MAHELKITPHNTIKGLKLGEVSIDNFIKIIKKRINKNDNYYDYGSNLKVLYEVNVFKKKDDCYMITFLNEENNEYSYYDINTEKYLYLSETLDRFSKITKKHEYEKECYKKIEENGYGTTKENKAYLNCLKNMKKNIIISNIKMLSPLVLVAILANILCFAYLGTTLIRTIAGLAGLIAIYCSITACSNEIEKGRSIIENIKVGTLLQNKIKKLEKKLSKTRENDGDNTVTIKTDKEALYRDNIINYMNSILNAADKLENNDRKEKLIKLREILDEYTEKCMEVSNSNSNGLTLNGGKRQIMMNTIEKLTTLEMEIADALKRDSKNVSMFSESEQLMQELNGRLEDIDNENKRVVVSSKGR